jgi:hypothetical protein
MPIRATIAIIVVSLVLAALITGLLWIGAYTVAMQ